MIQALVVSQVILLALVVVLALVVLALARQVGMLHERITPVGALVNDQGPGVGTELAQIRGQDLTGVNQVIPITAPTLLAFVSPTCPVCKRVLPILKTLASQEGFQLVLASDGPLEKQHEFVEAAKLSAYPYLLAKELGMQLGVGKLPYIFVLEAGGKIAAKGLVNTREHIESLLAARESGFASLRDYLSEQS